MEPLISRLSTFFPWLIDYTIDISILICLIFIIRSIVSKKLPAWWNYSLWIVLLLRMVIPFTFDSPLKIPNVVPISIDVSLFDAVLIEEDIVTPEFTPELSTAPQGWNIQLDDVLLSLWIACAIILGCYILIKNIRFRNAIKKEPLLSEKRVLDLLEECKNRMKIKTSLQVTVTGRVKSPALFGYVRPRLLLPVGVKEKLNDAELSYMFMHELGHLKRHDIGVSWLITFIQIFQWFNPFVWLAFYQMRLDQESACDASVLSRINHDQTIDYAGTIVGFLENFCRNHKLPALVGILENQSQIKKRITMIVNYRRNSKIMMFFSTTSLIAIGLIFFSLAGFAKSDHERAGLEASILQALPFDVQQELVMKGNDPAHKEKAVKFIENNQTASAVTQEKIVEDKAEQGKSEPERLNTLVVQNNNNIQEKAAMRLARISQKAPDVIQERVVKVRAEQEKLKPETQKGVVEVRDTKTEDKSETGRLAEISKKDSIEKSQERNNNRIEQGEQYPKTQELTTVVQNKNKETEAPSFSAAPQKASEIIKEDSNIDPETKGVLNNHTSTIHESEQVASVTALPEKNSNSGVDKSMQYLDLARSVYYISKSLGYSGVTSNTPENNPDEDKIHNFREVDEQPRVVSRFPPTYPFNARAKGIEGRVILRFVVDREGTVLDPKIVSSEPEGIFDEAALDAVVKYKLKPAMKGSKSVNSIVKLAMNFSLNDNYLKFAQR